MNAMLRSWRKAHDLYVREAAELMGVPLSTYEWIEYGNTPMSLVHINALIGGCMISRQEFMIDETLINIRRMLGGIE